MRKRFTEEQISSGLMISDTNLGEDDRHRGCLMKQSRTFFADLKHDVAVLILDKEFSYGSMPRD